MNSQRRYTLLYVYSESNKLDTLTGWLGRFLELIPLHEQAALYDTSLDLSGIDGILVDWSPLFASAIPRLQEMIAPRSVPVVVLADVTPAMRVAARMMRAHYVEPYPPSPAFIEALLTTWERNSAPTTTLNSQNHSQGDVSRGIGNNSRLTTTPSSKSSTSSQCNDTESPTQATLRENMRLVLDVDRHQCLINGEPIHLSLTGFKLLWYLKNHEGLCCRREVLFDEIWGPHYDPESDVITAAISVLRKTLKQHNVPNCIQTVRGVGYRFEGGRLA